MPLSEPAGDLTQPSFQLVVDASMAGKRLDSAIAEADRGLSRSQVKNLIEKNLVLLDGKTPAKAGVLLTEGQRIEVTVPAPVKLDLTPQEVAINIIYEDDDLAVLEKPAGISVHPSNTENKPTVVHGLLYSLKSLSSVGGVERPGIVHRIDKGTSGILVVSKTDAAHLGLAKQFKAHTIDRRYRALVYGDMSQAKAGATEGRIETFYGRSSTNRKKMTSKLTEGRKAITHWKVLEAHPSGISFIECRLETGRTHQIRVHLSELGFPLVGDQLYCENERRAKSLAKKNTQLAQKCAALDHQMLHAYYLGFEHPISKKQLTFESKVPADFQEIYELARI